jgi:hypothetical protein
VDRSREEFDAKLDRLSEVVTEGFAELKETSRSQAETARMQAESVSRLVALFEQERNRS